MEEIPIIWTETTKKQLEQIYLYIAEASSITQADNVFENLVNSTSKLPEQPQKNPPDKYKIDNDSSYRAYEIYHFRISYKITEEAIYIVRIRSTRQNPKGY